MTLKEKVEAALRMTDMPNEAIKSGHVKTDEVTDIYSLPFRDCDKRYMQVCAVNKETNTVYVGISSPVDEPDRLKLLEAVNELNIMCSGQYTFITNSGVVIISTELDGNIYEVEGISKCLLDILSAALTNLPKITGEVNISAGEEIEDTEEIEDK